MILLQNNTVPSSLKVDSIQLVHAVLVPRLFQSIILHLVIIILEVGLSTPLQIIIVVLDIKFLGVWIVSFLHVVQSNMHVLPVTSFNTLKVYCGVSVF